MVGDSFSDMQFGKSLGMTTFLIASNEKENMDADYQISGFSELINHLKFN